MTTYSEESLVEMTYREVQAIAKTFGIAANKKKDELVNLIVAATQPPSVQTVTVEAVDIEEAVTTIVEEAPVVQESEPEVAPVVVAAVTPAKKSVPPTPVAAPATPAPATASKISRPVTAVKEISQEISIADAEAPAVEEADEEEFFEEEYAYDAEPVEEEYSTVNNLVDVFSSVVRLNGLPTPQGKKTIFESETPVAAANTGFFVNWGLNFQSPAGKQTPKSNSNFQTPCNENADPQYYEEEGDADEYYSPEKPANTHIHFFSPDVKVGNSVHWRYEDYDLEAQKETAPAPPSTARKALSSVNTPTTTGKKTFAKSTAKKTPGGGMLLNANVPDVNPLASPHTRQETLVNFWLSKGTPGKALFN